MLFAIYQLFCFFTLLCSLSSSGLVRLSPLTLFSTLLPIILSVGIHLVFLDSAGVMYSTVSDEKLSKNRLYT